MEKLLKDGAGAMRLFGKAWSEARIQHACALALLPNACTHLQAFGLPDYLAKRGASWGATTRRERELWTAGVAELFKQEPDVTAQALPTSPEDETRRLLSWRARVPKEERAACALFASWTQRPADALIYFAPFHPYTQLIDSFNCT